MPVAPPAGLVARAVAVAGDDVDDCVDPSLLEGKCRNASVGLALVARTLVRRGGWDAAGSIGSATT
jgi:hypothetical protein